MMLEVIATNAQEAVTAEKAGADRIELIANISEGGLTPQFEIVEQTAEAVSIPVHVIVRPHSRTFCYDKEDIALMRDCVRHIRTTRVAGIVIGALTNEHEVDVDFLRCMLDEAEHLAVTFHRAFDEASDLERALGVLAEFPEVSRILTSGGVPSALDAISTIRRLVELSRSTSMTILAGSGLRVEALQSFLEETGVSEVHFGTGIRFEGSGSNPIDPAKVTAAKEILKNVIQKGDQADDRSANSR